MKSILQRPHFGSCRFWMFQHGMNSRALAAAVAMPHRSRNGDKRRWTKKRRSLAIRFCRNRNDWADSSVRRRLRNKAESPLSFVDFEYFTVSSAFTAGSAHTLSQAAEPSGDLESPGWLC